MKLALPLAFMAICQFSISQNQDIKSWQEVHPNVLFIESTTYAHLSEEKKDLLGDNIIVYQNSISFNDIQAYIDQQELVNSTSKSLVDENGPNADVIKLWLTKNADVKIISRDYYSQLSHFEQQSYLEVAALIYNGNFLSLEDIENYNETH